MHAHSSIGSSALVAVLIAGSLASSADAQILETETARMLQRGQVEASMGIEVQRSSAGTERAIPIGIEFGVTDRVSLLVEPVLYTAIRPKAGPNATGVGDIEVTGTLLVLPETSHRPAFAVAGEVKIPTARNVYIGTTKTDYAGYLIASKHFGQFDTHANVGYTIVGKPTELQLRNIVNGAIGTVFQASPRTILFGEVLANSGAVSGNENDTGSMPTVPGTVITPEAPAGELVGTIGLGRYISPCTLLSLGVSYDNSNAVLLHPGITILF